MDMNKKTRSNDNVIGLPRFPREIILYNILTKVPAKSLHRFRCVCKQWSDSFDADPLFKSLYSHYKERGFICFVDFSGQRCDKGTTYSFTFLDIDRKVSREIPFRAPEEVFGDSQRVSLDIVDSLNGVLLLGFSKSGGQGQIYASLYVYNPVSAIWVHIQSDTRTYGLYLAYDPIISKYKVANRNFDILTVDDECRGSNPWRHVSPRPGYSYTCITVNSKPVLVNYALHWICIERKRGRSVDSEEGYGHILRFDVSKEKLSTIELPVENASASGRLLEMGGLLCFLDSVAHDRIGLKLWYWNDEWVIKCDINLPTSIGVGVGDERIGCGTVRYSWIYEPCIIVTDPKCKIIFTFRDSSCKIICPYDMELKHWDLIHAGPALYEDQVRFPRIFCNPRSHYWNDNQNALST